MSHCAHARINIGWLHLATDLETEVLQIFAATTALDDLISDRLLIFDGSVTVEQSGSRSAREHEIVGLTQILKLSQAYALELSIKLLHTVALTPQHPEPTHNLSKLFAALPRAQRNKLAQEWANEPRRSDHAKSFSFEQFLKHYSKFFEESRYLHERIRSYKFSSMDFTKAVLLVLGEVLHCDPDGDVLRTVYDLAQLKLAREGKEPLPGWEDIERTIQKGASN